MIMPAWLHSAAPWLTSHSHSQVSQIFPDHPLQMSILRKLVFERPTQSGHLLRDRLAVILLRLGADVAAGVSMWPCLRISSSVALLQKPGTSA